MAAEGPPSKRARIVLFGDSITQLGFSVGGWVARLSDRYCRRADVLNRGYSGYNTRWALPVLDSLIADGLGQGTVLWTVFFGANDSAGPASHRQHVPLEEYEANLTTMLKRIKEASADAKIVVITPPALDEDKWFQSLKNKNPQAEKSDRTDAEAGRYAEAASRVASACGAEVLNLHQAMRSGGRSFSDFLGDGLHLSEAGQELVFDLLAALVAEKFPEIAVQPDKFTGNCHNSGSTSSLREEFPWHDALAVEPPHHPMLAKPPAA